MAETKEKKGFRPVLYAIFSGVIVAVILVLLTIFAVTTRYTAFSPDKVAKSYVDTIVQNGDGYNAYKNTLVSKNQKYGDFIIDAYMAPYVNDGDDAKKADFVGTGNAEEDEKSNLLYNTMFDYYVQLVDQYGLDNYDAFYKAYFAMLKDKRAEIYGDDYMDTEFMFSVFESNVGTYGQLLTGTKEKIADDKVTILVPETIGIYQQIFGNDYKLTAEVVDEKELSGDEYTKYIADYTDRIANVANEEIATAQADAFKLEDTKYEKKILFIKKEAEKNTKTNYINAYKNLDFSKDISAVTQCTVSVKANGKDEVAKVTVYVVKIGNSWYVDNTNTDTSALYEIGNGDSQVTTEAIMQQKADFDAAKSASDKSNNESEK